MSHLRPTTETPMTYPHQRPEEEVPIYQTYTIDKPSSPSSYHTSFPTTLPPRPSPSQQQPWRSFLHRFSVFSLSSYSLIHTPSSAARLRHIAMITILVLRTGTSALSILSAVVKGNVASIVVYSLLAVLGVWFTATCLAIIGDAEGDKKLWRMTLKRWHFDTFLGLCVVIHAALIVLWFFGLSGWGLELTSVGMWIAILGVAWVAGWQPELPTYQRQWAT